MTDPYRVIHVDERPDEAAPGTLYAVGENGHVWCAAFACPCGCGATVELNMLGDDHPCWKLEEHADGPTLTPSINRVVGCRSHFFIRSGRVVWA